MFSSRNRTPTGQEWFYINRETVSNKSWRLHEETRTGESFYTGELLDFISLFHVVCFFVVPWPTWRSHPELTKTAHALPVRVHREADFTSKGVVTSRLHDTGVKFSLECKNRGENNASAKVVPVSCKQPLTIIANVAFNKQKKTMKLD